MIASKGFQPSLPRVSELLNSFFLFFFFLQKFYKKVVVEKTHINLFF
jgi:hypothetical protein